MSLTSPLLRSPAAGLVKSFVVTDRGGRQQGVAERIIASRYVSETAGVRCGLIWVQTYSLWLHFGVELSV